jgi:tRNA(Ile)-lysidine synthase
MDLLARIRRFVRQHALFRAETRVVVALSGGSDSVALAQILRELDVSGDVRLVGAAHFNHQLRDEAAQRDEEFSASVARTLDMPFAADREDVRERARGERRSIEDAAREPDTGFRARSAAVRCRRRGARHTRDDRPKPFCSGCCASAGTRGLAAMCLGTAIVRPVLDCRRMELRRYLDERHLAWVNDETNEDVTIPRNRIRAELMPLLVDRFNPAIVDVLANEAELARETWAWLESAAREFEKGDGSLFPGAESGGTPGSEKTPVPFFEVGRLLAAPPPLRRLVLWRAMNAAAGGRPVSFEHVQAALELLEAGHGAIDAPGHRVQRLGPRLVLTGRQNAESLENLDKRSIRREPFQYPLSIQERSLAEAGCIVAAELGAGAGRRKPRPGREGGRCAFRRDLCHGPLAVRNRRPGDKFQPVGVGGRKKLQDYFVDRKVASGKRDEVPIVVDRSDRIVWVAGYGIDEAFRVTDASQSVLLLRLKVVGGSA